MSITLLSDETIKKIAAGEVVENPYSVVKEIVENSIDSGATNIKVEIKNAGKKEIIISDNGSGIKEDEIELAFTKHATSKLKNFDDIYSIFSFGFRGEALSSISSVSKVSINTRTKDTDYGIHCYLENNKILKKNKIGMNLGTTIYIRDLFYNVPIRKKFLKSDVYESSIITILMYSFAIANQNIEFKYIKDGKTIFETNKKNTLKDNITEILGSDISNNLIAVDIRDSDYKIYGYLTNSHYYRSNRNYQFLFVNKRLVFNDKIRNIIEKSISTLIPKGKFPAFIFFIEVNPNLIDINVHPNKKKIKFIFEDKLLSLFNDKILDIVLNNTKSDFIFSKEKKDDAIFIEKVIDDFKNDDELEKNKNIDNETIEYDDNYKTNNIINKFSYEDLFKVKKDDIYTVNEDDDIEKYVVKEENVEPISVLKQVILDESFEKKSKKLTEYKILGKIFSNFLLLYDDEDFVILDLLSCEYRILYEEIYNEYKNNSIKKQLLLFPIVLELDEYEMSVFNIVKDKLDTLGIEASIFDQKSIAVRTLPKQLSNLDAEDIRKMIIDLLIENKEAFELKVYKMIYKKKIVIKDNISNFEINEILNKLSNINVDFNFFDKKIIRKISKTDFEKIFFKG